MLQLASYCGVGVQINFQVSIKGTQCVGIDIAISCIYSFEFIS